MSESDKKNEIDDMSFDKFAEKFGVKFDGGAKVPYDMDSDVFKLLSLHYLEKIRTYANVRILNEMILDKFEKCTNLKEIPDLCSKFRELLNVIG